jgi:2-phosphoglycerate kinase
MGKSTLITQLAERINISNILQTSIVKQVMDNFAISSPPISSSQSESTTKYDLKGGNSFDAILTELSPEPEEIIS